MPFRMRSPWIVTLLLIPAGFLASMSRAGGGVGEPVTAPRPNIVIVFTDDQGYGDLGCQGHPTIRTPELDRMAREGLRLTQFYVAASVCTPSRAGLITGRLPIRTGMCGNRRVLFPDSVGGLQDSEITIAEALREAGYRTACIGKWHLGHLPSYLPTRHGFDSYYGIPYSNDMNNRKRGDPPVPLMRDEEVIEAPVDQTTLTRRYTDEAIAFITDSAESGDAPFFLYLPHTFPHIPLFASDEFRGSSPRGLYGDVIEEIDHSVGRILQTLRDLEIDEETLVVFTSDNGPWLIMDQRGGSAGLLRGGKGSTWEGGMRVPGLFWWPGTIPAGQIMQELGSTLDLFPTAMAFAGVEMPTDRIYDGYDLSAVLLGKTSGRIEDGPRQEMFFYRQRDLFAYRQGNYKLHRISQAGYREKPKTHDQPLLFNLQVDPSERFDLAADESAVVTQMQRVIDEHLEQIEQVKREVPSQLDR